MILEKHESRASQEVGKVIAQSESVALKSTISERVRESEKHYPRASHPHRTALHMSESDI
jgi:hypothetical protein